MRISDWSSDVCSSDLSDNIFLLGFRTPEENRMLDNAEGMRAAEELTRAISSLDEAVFASIYTDDAEIWHNNTNAIQTKTENRSEEHTSELQSLMRISYAVFCLQKKNTNTHKNTEIDHTK